MLGSGIIRTMFMAVMLLAVAPVQDVLAQAQNTVTQPAKQPQQKPAETQNKAKTLPPVYGPQLLRLAEILGGLHFLRNLCGAKEGKLWREEMEKLLVAEKPDAQQKARLVGRFNRGYRGFHAIYRECTPPAAEAANRYLREAIKLSGNIPSRFGR